MNTKTTFLVLLIALGLAGYFAFFETAPHPDATPDAAATSQTGKPLFAAEALPDAKVKSMKIQQAGGPAAVIQRDAKNTSDWNQVQPVRFAMQGWQVSDIVSAASGLRYTDSFTPGDRKVSLADLGLAPARVTVTFEGDGIKPVTLALGNQTAAGRAYVTIGTPSESSTVYVVGTRLHEALSKKISDLRSVTLPTLTAGQARRIELTEGSQTIDLSRHDDRWTIDKPVVARADRDATEGLLSAVGAISIDHFVEDKPADLSAYGLDKPQTVLTVALAQPAPAPKKDAKKKDAKDAKPAQKIVTHKLLIGAPTDLDKASYFAAWDDTSVVFALRKADVEKFRKKVDDLRDPHLTPDARSDIREVTLDRPASGGGKLHFVLNKGNWEFGDPKPGFSLEVPEVDKLFDALLNTKAASFAPVQPDAGTPLATVTLAVAGRTEPETLTVREHGKDQLAVVRGGESAASIVPRAALAPVFADALGYRDRDVLELTPDQLASATIHRSGEYPATYDLIREAPAPEGPPTPGKKPAAKTAPKPGAWKLDGYDPGAVTQALSMLTPLHAESWLDKAPAAKPADTTVTVTLRTTDHKDRTLTLDTATRVATLTGVDKPFKLDTAAATALGAELRDRRVVKLEVDQIGEVRGEGWSVRRDSEGQFRAALGATLDEPKAAAIFDALASLRAEHFVAAPAGNPAATLTVVPAKDKPITLKIWMPKGASPVVEAVGKTFTVPADAAKSLTTKPVK